MLVHVWRDARQSARKGGKTGAGLGADRRPPAARTHGHNDEVNIMNLQRTLSKALRVLLVTQGEIALHSRS